MPIVQMIWWDSKGKKYLKPVELTEKDLPAGKITFIEIVSKEKAYVRLRLTDSGAYHSHLAAGQSPQGWACYIGRVNAAGTMLEGEWRRDDGAYGGGGKFTLPLI